VANNYEDSLALLRFALGEMERRRGNSQLQEQAPRWVVVVDEVAQLVEIHPEAGAFITQLSQMAGGLKINLVVASQAANPTVFGDKGSLARANFASRLVFQLPHDQSYLATGLAGQHTERLGGKGDGLAITGGRVTRFRAALPQRQDFEVLPFRHAEPEMPESYLFAGDAALEENGWQVPPDMLAYALVVKNSATQIQAHFGGSMNKSRVVRDYATALRGAVNALQQRRTAA
jgi:DNA segregation ATPase FtsK/SpoIIIE-like protein